MRMRNVLTLCFLLSLACNYVTSLSFPKQVKPVNLQAELESDGITQIEFGNGGSLTVYGSEQDAGKTIQVTADERLNVEGVEENFNIERIYEIECIGCTGDFSAVVTLPIESPSISKEAGEDYQIAYKDEEQWLILPSTYDPKTRTVSATVSHFTKYGIIKSLFNSKPKASLVVSPTMIDPDDLDTQNLKIKVYAKDKDKDRLKVKAAIVVNSLVGEVLDLLATTYKASLESFRIACHVSKGFPGPECDVLTESLNVVKKPGDFVVAELELFETTPGYYSVSDLSLSQLGVDWHLVNNIRVIVRVYEDKNTKASLEIERYIPVKKGLLELMELIEPGPALTTICPPRPEFSWSHGIYHAYQFRLVEGNDPWGRGSGYAWTCNDGMSEDQTQCEGDSPPESFFASTWTPPKDLKDGKVYSWGMAVSDKKSETSFSPKDAPRTGVFQFTVDKRLKGETCLQNVVLPSEEVNALIWLEDGIVQRSEVKGKYKKGSLSWKIRDQKGELIDLYAEKTNSIDPLAVINEQLAGYVIVGDLEVYLNAITEKEPQTISNVIRIEKSSVTQVDQQTNPETESPLQTESQDLSLSNIKSGYYSGKGEWTNVKCKTICEYGTYDNDYCYYYYRSPWAHLTINEDGSFSGEVLEYTITGKVNSTIVKHQSFDVGQVSTNCELTVKLIEGNILEGYEYCYRTTPSCDAEESGSFTIYLYPK